MLKTLKHKWPLLALVGISTLSVGLMVAMLKTTNAFKSPEQVEVESIQLAAVSPVLGYVNQSAAQRAINLASIAQGDEGIERDRARFMLATDYINQGQAEQALPLLENLENSYAVLAAYVLLRRGQAQAAAGDRDSAIATWTQLTQKHPESAAAAEALHALGEPAPSNSAPVSAVPAKTDAWDQLLKTIPSHPLSVDVAFRQLDQPGQRSSSTESSTGGSTDSEEAGDEGLDEVSLLKLIAYHGLEHRQYTEVLDRLVREYSSALTPDDWAAIGFGYWETQNYAAAGEAYAKAPSTPRNQYRAARGQEWAGKGKEAAATYALLNQTFPEAPETATGLLNLADLQDAQSAMKTLDSVIARFPDQAAAAIAKRADILDQLQSPDSAKQARASILSQHPESEAATEIRFKQANANAEAGNYTAAISWAQQLVDDAPKENLAAEAGFWLGKWTLRQNQPDVARQAFEQVIANHPESYYAWRSAIYLDWNVGSFDTVRTFQPKIALPERRSPLPAGTPELEELYLIGHNQTAWNQWQTEFIDQQMPTVREQFTDGVLRLGIGDNLDGIFMVSSLAWRDLPEEVAEYEMLKRTPAFGQSIYPFPYLDLIMEWAKERDLNPLLVTALMRQESRFQADIRSVVGAVGLMQVMPETADWIGEQIGENDFTLSAPADNVKFGTWYLDFTHRQYDDNSLYAVASYNAGPGAIASWIDENDFTSADEFVEQIPYPETKGYVESVFGGYWNYLRVYDPEIAAKINAL